MPFTQPSSIEANFLAAFAEPNTPEMREARTLDALFPARFTPPAPGDVFVGRVRDLNFGLDARRGGFFFSDETPSTHQKMLAACSPRLRESITGAGPLRAHAGWTGFALDYDTLLQQGLQGLRVRIDARRNIAHVPRAAWDGMLATLDVIQGSALALADSAAADGLERSAAALEAVVMHPPRSLYEALQLLLLYSAHAGFPEQHGRMDEYLGDLYADDLLAGRITPEDAERMLADFFRMCADSRGAPGRVTIGGRGRRNPSRADACATLIINVIERQLGFTARLDVRTHQGDAPAMRERLHTLAANDHAALHDDDALLPEIEHDFAVTLNVAERYVPIGDETYSLGHAGCHAPLCELDAAVLSTADFAPYVEAAAEYHALACDVAGIEAPCLVQSLLLDGCIARGETAFTGGVRFLGGALIAHNAAHLRDALRTCARDQRERTWLHAYVCGFA